jgi:hypothetical protein
VLIHPCPETLYPVFEFGERDFHADKNWGRGDDKGDEIQAGVARMTGTTGIIIRRNIYPQIVHKR